ncbi:MAG: DNA methyltransferase [Candidatus Heimdallarchaeota archaeon]
MPHPQDLNFCPFSEPIRPIDTRGTKYSAFTYWSKKPENIVRNYIEHYSREDEITLDPFSGSGTTAIESLILRRKAIAFDINPIAVYFARMLAISPVDLSKYAEFIGIVTEKTLELAEELYATKCRLCGQNVQARSILYDKTTPKQVNYVCSCRNRVQKAPPTKSDLERVQIAPESSLYNTRVTTRFLRNPRKQISSKSPLDYFTGRNLIVMDQLWRHIQELPESTEKELAKFTFLAKLRLMGKDYFRSTSSAASFLWIPENNWIERNVFSRYIQSYQQIRQKKEITNTDIGSFYRESQDPQDVLESDKTVFFGIYDAKAISEIFPSNSIDFILTDPPYADQALYLEYSLLWQPWFSFNPKFDEEIVVTDSPERPSKKRHSGGVFGAGERQYIKDLEAAFKAMRIVLQKDRWLAVWFRCRNDLLWEGFIDAIRNAGLEKISVVRQPVDSSTWNRGINPSGTLNEYLILSYRNTGKSQNIRPCPENEEFLIELEEICQKEMINGKTEAREIWSAAVAYFLGKYDSLPSNLTYSKLISILKELNDS